MVTSLNLGAGHLSQKRRENQSVPFFRIVKASVSGLLALLLAPL
jgi:hypothetical protein